MLLTCRGARMHGALTRTPSSACILFPRPVSTTQRVNEQTSLAEAFEHLKPTPSDVGGQHLLFA